MSLCTFSTANSIVKHSSKSNIYAAVQPLLGNIFRGCVENDVKMYLSNKFILCTSCRACGLRYLEHIATNQLSPLTWFSYLGLTFRLIFHEDIMIWNSFPMIVPLLRNPLVAGGFSSQRANGVLLFHVANTNKTNKQSNWQWYETHELSHDVIMMLQLC